MSTTDNGRAEARSRANRRLRTMTIGTALLGVAATGGFGWLAAVAPHASTTAATTAIVVTTADAGSATTSSTSAGTTPTVTIAQPTAHASTGGS